MNVAATDENRADGINEIVHRIDIRRGVCPLWHGACRREKATQQQEADDEKPHDEDGLLHRVAIIGNDEAERREESGQKHGEQIDQRERPLASDVVDGPGEQQADRNKEKRH